MKLLQVIIPVSMDTSTMTDYDIKTFIGILILLNIIYVISLVICTRIHLNNLKERKKYVTNYPFSFFDYFEYVFMDGANIFLCEVVNVIVGAIDIIILIIYLGCLIGKIL